MEVQSFGDVTLFAGTIMDEQIVSGCAWMSESECVDRIAFESGLH